MTIDLVDPLLLLLLFIAFNVCLSMHACHIRSNVVVDVCVQVTVGLH